MRCVRIRMDESSLERLREMRRLWPRIIPGQQSNLVQEAGEGTQPAAEEAFVRFSLGRQNASTDEDRLRCIALAWQSLQPGKQRELIETARSVSL